MELGLIVRHNAHRAVFVEIPGDLGQLKAKLGQLLHGELEQGLVVSLEVDLTAHFQHLTVQLQEVAVSQAALGMAESLSFWGKLMDLGRHLVLPITVITVGSVAGMSRFMRSSMLEVLRQDFILTAKAKGLPARVVIFRHALRNALLPVITLLGLSVPGLIGGSVIIETIFALPGLGQLFYAAVMARDYPLIMGNLVLGAVLTLAGNMLADIGYGLADPRIRAQGKRQ